MRVSPAERAYTRLCRAASAAEEKDLISREATYRCSLYKRLLIYARGGLRGNRPAHPAGDPAPSGRGRAERGHGRVTLRRHPAGDLAASEGAEGSRPGERAARRNPAPLPGAPGGP